MTDEEPSGFEKGFTLRCNKCGSFNVCINVSVTIDLQYICGDCGQIEDV